MSRERKCEVCERILPPKREGARCAECAGEILVYRQPWFTVVTDPHGNIIKVERKEREG